MSLGDGITWADWVRLVAAEHGVHDLTAADVDFLLWERSAWPATTDIAYLRPQLDAAFTLATSGGPRTWPHPCMRCGQGVATGSGLCGPCAET